jgi:hypothetical protein
MSGGYYLTAEPVGVCSCHTCTCAGCHRCDPPEDLPEPTDDYPEDDE